MDRREQIDDQAEALRIAMNACQSRLWTAIPGVVKEFPGASALGPMTVDVQPTVNQMFRAPAGDYQSLQMPVLLDCPVLWQGGGGVTMTFPITAGDECLVILSSRCIDAWWQLGWQPGAAMNPPDIRMHNLSDGFALVGVRSLPRSYAVDMANAALISDDGQAWVKLNPTTHALSIVANGGVTINGVTIDSSGNLMTTGTITGTTDVIGGGKHLKTHIHTGGTISGDTGEPV